MAHRKHFSFIYILLSVVVSFSSCGEKHEEGGEEEHHSHSGHIMLSEESIRNFGLEHEKVGTGNFHDVIKTSGVIESSGSSVYTVTARKSGIFHLAGGIAPGSEIKSGEKIGEISAEGMEGGDINAAARSNLKAARTEYERLKPLYEEGLVTASAYREAERAYMEAQALAGSNSGVASGVVSPGSGIMTQLYVKSGEYVGAGSPVAEIVKNTRQVLKVDLPGRYSKHLGHITTANFHPEGGDEILRLADMEGEKISGGEAAGSDKGYIPVYFSFKGTGSTIPGGYAEVYLICGERPGVISVPREALLEIQGENYVYVVKEHGEKEHGEEDSEESLEENTGHAEEEHGEHGEEYEKRLVKTGATDGERVEILSGLDEGEIIVSKGATVVRMAEISAIAPPAHHH